MTRLTLRLSVAEKQHLESLSRRTGRSVSDLARWAISDMLATAKERKKLRFEIDLDDLN